MHAGYICIYVKQWNTSVLELFAYDTCSQMTMYHFLATRSLIHLMKVCCITYDKFINEIDVDSSGLSCRFNLKFGAFLSKLLSR